MALPEIIKDIEARVKDTGDIMTGTLSWGGDIASLNLRAGHASYDGVISYQTSGNEAMLFTTKNAVTSFMFVNGEDTIANITSDRWTKVTPGLQIKNNSVYIGSLIANGVNPAYKFYVNGTSCFTGKLQVNAPIFGYNYTNSNNAAALIWDKPGVNYTGVGANGSADTIYFGACDIDGAWNTSYKQKWQFNGTVIANTLSVSSNVIFTSALTNNSAPTVIASFKGDNSANGFAFTYTSQLTVGNAERLDSLDTRSATRTPQDTPRGITLNFKQNSTYGLSDGGSYLGLLSWRSYSSSTDLSGGYPFEIAYTANGNLWTRIGTSATAWGSWTKLWKKGDSVTGAVWNDYAECRKATITEAGYVLYEVGDDSLDKTYRRLQPFAGVSSDTWGFSQGQTDEAKTHIAVAGRVLVYPWQDRNNYKPGDCVCAAPDGKVDIMTREEVIQYPDRIVGTVSSVPTYDRWGGGEGADRDPVDVNGRIWIKVR